MNDNWQDDGIRRRLAQTSPRLANVLRRVYLTYRYHGLASVILRVITFPLRFTPVRRLIPYGPAPRRDISNELSWYVEHGRSVTIVIPSFRDADRVTTLLASIRATTDPARVRVVVADDASGGDHVAALRAIEGIEVIEGDSNKGFAANVNRGLRAADPEHDVVVLNSDVIALPGWLECLQYASSQADDIGIVGPKLLYPDGAIQSAGTIRHPDKPEWFDHRYRFKPRDWGPADVAQPVLAVTGACMYIRRDLLETISPFDECFAMAYEDVDIALRAWQAGYRVIYWPSAELYHVESSTRGTEVGERERSSQQVFWKRWDGFFDAREPRSDDGVLRVIYVTEDTGVGGGHRDVFEHLNGLHERGHEVELWSLAGEPKWFDLRAPVRRFDDYDALVQALKPIDAIKVATWWNTAGPVWTASLLRGIPVYFVQDIETSYYRDDERMRDAVLASYRHEFRYMTISSWNRDRLRELGIDAELIAPGIDLDLFRPLPDIARRPDMVLALGRSNPLKNLQLTIDAWRALPQPRPELCLFGIEPDVATDPGMRYVTAPTDAEVNALLNQATVFVQTSRHEGFALPPLEAMATGAAVVCTDAHGNRDFCVDGQNCLIPKPNRSAVQNAIGWLLGDPLLRQHVGRSGIETAQGYGWPGRIGELERFFTEIAMPREIAPSTMTLPQRHGVHLR